MGNDQVCTVLTDEYDLGYMGDLRSSFIEKFEKAVRMTFAENACPRVKQVKTNICSFRHGNDSVGELAFHDRTWKYGVGRAISQALTQGICKMRSENQVDVVGAEHDSTDMLKVIRDLSKEQAIREDDRRSGRRGFNKAMHTGYAGTLHGKLAGQSVRNPPGMFE